MKKMKTLLIASFFASYACINGADDYLSIEQTPQLRALTKFTTKTTDSVKQQRPLSQSQFPFTQTAIDQLVEALSKDQYKDQSFQRLLPQPLYQPVDHNLPVLNLYQLNSAPGA